MRNYLGMVIGHNIFEERWLPAYWDNPTAIERTYRGAPNNATDTVDVGTPPYKV